MVYIFYTRSDKKLNDDIFQYYLGNLPFYFQSKILKYRHWQDAQRSLLGKALLMNGLSYLGLKQYSLRQLKVSDLKKPYFDNSIDFNISHSGRYVLCAISLIGKVGVDVEEIKPIIFTEFKSHFSNEEWNEIEQSGNIMVSFYRHWTQKEAFLKATGFGLNMSSGNEIIKDNKIFWNKKEWYLYEINLDPKYIFNVSLENPSTKFMVKEISFFI